MSTKGLKIVHSHAEPEKGLGKLVNGFNTKGLESVDSTTKSSSFIEGSRRSSVNSSNSALHSSGASSRSEPVRGGELRCTSIEFLTAAFADNELSQEQVNSLLDHAKKCKRCLDFMTSYMNTVALARKLGRRELRPEVRNRLRETLNRKLGINLSLIK